MCSLSMLDRVRLSSLAGEVLKSKSPAEFFADNQNIAGFDNVSTLTSNDRESVDFHAGVTDQTIARVFHLYCAQGSLLGMSGYLDNIY